jgi:hypothetical protein
MIGALIWVDRALAAALERPAILCLTQRDREMIARGQWPQSRRDYLVSKTVNFHEGVPGMLWWHLRGATIRTTYVAFWSASDRNNIFRRLTSRMKDCPTGAVPTPAPAIRLNRGRGA